MCTADSRSSRNVSLRYDYGQRAILLSVGGILGFALGWLQYQIEQRDGQKRLVSSLLLKLSALADEHIKLVEQQIRPLLKHASATGVLINRRDLRRLLSVEVPQDRFPVYYGSVEQ